MPYDVYILVSQTDGTYYIGSTQNIYERLQRHNQGRSQYTKAKIPWTLVYSEELSVKLSAIKIENQIKKPKSKRFIESLLRTTE